MMDIDSVSQDRIASLRNDYSYGRTPWVVSCWVVQTRLIHRPTTPTTLKALPVRTGNSVWRRVDMKFQGVHGEPESRLAFAVWTTWFWYHDHICICLAVLFSKALRFV